MKFFLFSKNYNKIFFQKFNEYLKISLRIKLLINPCHKIAHKDKNKMNPIAFWENHFNTKNNNPKYSFLLQLYHK